MNESERGEGDGFLVTESSGFSTLSEDRPEELSFSLVHLLGSDIVTDAEGDGIQVFEGDAGFEEGVGVGQ
jgi:hypothetical protein